MQETLYYLNEPKLSASSSLVMKKSSSTLINNKISDSDMKEIPENLNIENNFQLALYNKVKSVTNSKYSILSITHNPYSERYIFSTEPENTTLDFYYNNKNLVSSIRIIRAGTDSDKLLKDLEVIKNQVLTDLLSNQGLHFADNQKHLEDFYIDIKSKIDNHNIKVANIDHNEWHEKYYFVRNDELAVFIFYYNQQLRFKRTVTDKNKSNSEDLIKLITNILL